MADIKVTDLGFEKIIANDSKLAGNGVKFGIQAGQGDQEEEGVHKGADILDIAIYNEFGTEHIPARPFMKDFANKNEHVLLKAMDRQAKNVFAGMPVATALADLGEFAQKHQKNHIRKASRWAEANAPSTIRQKGSSKPLIDTGALVNAVRYEVLK
ncbi:hypothetical protein [Advenella sp. EE-W14]|uniref:hypothetical protein n=1 Tax=Advenella sp. EE-W14 TaxID=2722705 RepID=UPI00145D46B9|nr:hypothetical protein [Advenella sp. EE-W14]